MIAQLQEVGKGFRDYLSDKAMWPVWIGIAFLLVVVLVMIRLLWPHWRAGRAVRARFAMFAAQNALSRADAALLLRMGKQRFPHEPALIFVSPSTFDALAPTLGLDQARASELRQKLYS